MEAARKAGLASIKRKEFFLSTQLIKAQDIFPKGPRISYPICPLQPNQILACTKASASWLTNGETPPRYLVPIKDEHDSSANLRRTKTNTQLHPTNQLTLNVQLHQKEISRTTVTL
ncbi:unnamed protein product [Rotaria magnacalcarata]